MAGRAIIIEWDGEEYVIPENEVFEVGEAVEEILPLTELAQKGEKVNSHKLARALAVMMSHAGADVEPSDIRRRMMFQSGGGEAFIQGTINALYAVLMDGMPEEMAEAPAETGKKKTAASSKPATRSRSKSSGSRRQNSGK